MSPHPWGSRARPWPIPITALDAYCAMRNGQWGMTDDNLLARLDGTAPPPEAATIGSAVHAGIERAMTLHRVVDAGPLDIRHPDYDIDVPLDVVVPRLHVVEQDIEWMLETAHGWIRLRGVVDGIAGATLIEWKTTRRAKLEHYQDSIQWRAYLAAMGEHYQAVQYHILPLSIRGGRRIQVTDHLVLTCHRYPQLTRDVRHIAGELAAWLDAMAWQPPPKRAMDIF